MNAVPIKKGLGLIVAGTALAGVTTLLTLLFSVLGNLSCAVVAGMIFGSARRWQWHVFPVSLVFPGVILALSHYSKVELPVAKVYLIAILTATAFWVVLGLTFGVRIFERKAGDASPAGSGGGESGSSATASNVPVPSEFNVAQLQGSWTCEEAGPDGKMQQKMLQVENGKFSLSISSSRRRERIIARGRVAINEAEAGQVEFTSERPV